MKRGVSKNPNYPDGCDAEDRFRRFDRPGQNEQIDLARSMIGNINDLIFNGTNNPRLYSPVYELTDIAGVPQTFDTRGNLTHSHTGIDLEWDADDRLSRTIVDAGDTAGIEGTNDYFYDATGKRVAKKITRNGSVVSHTIFVHAGPNCIAEYASAAAPTSPDREFVYGDSIDSLVLISDTNDTRRLLATRNQQWSVVALVDLSDGSVVERYTYDVFGARRVLDASGAEIAGSSQYGMSASQYGNPYGYTSRRNDLESGLMYFRARMYDPTTGEFLSRDPLGYVDGMSLYRGYFVTHENDPSGLFSGHDGWEYDDPICVDGQCGLNENRLRFGRCVRCPIKTCEEVCEMGKKKGFGLVAYAKVICYDGGPCPCVYASPGRWGINPGDCPNLDKLWLLHEIRHIKYGKSLCTWSCEATEALYPNEKIGRREECLNHKIDLKILRLLLPRQPEGKCKEFMKKLARDVEEFLIDECKGIVDERDIGE